jgi:hypothetical protein
VITLDRMAERLERIESLLFTSLELTQDLPRQEVEQQRMDRIGLILTGLDKLMQSHAALEKRWDESDKLMPTVLARRLREFNTLKGQLDAIGSVLSQLLALKAPRKKKRGKK